jgi:MoaA/NifB/PqqE/SkfB family radical SAM enzyme
VVSLDASNNKILSSIRGEGVFEKIVSNIHAFQQFKERNKNCATGISNCVTIMNQNIDDLYNIILLSQELKFNDVIFQPVLFDNTNQIKKGNKPGTMIPLERISIMEQAIQELIDFKKSEEKNYNYIINSIKNLELIKKYFKGNIQPEERKCYAGFNRLQITQDSKVYMCAALENSQDVSFANIQKDKLKDLWWSPEARQFRRQIKKSRCCCMQRCASREKFERIEGIWEKVRYFG